MENLAPPVILSEFLVLHLRSGDGVRVAIHKYLEDTTDELSNKVRNLAVTIDTDGDYQKIIEKESKPQRRLLLEICRDGLMGQPTLERVIEYKKEVEWLQEQELETFFRELPIRSLIPIMIFQIPALMLLLFGPILKSFLESL